MNKEQILQAEGEELSRMAGEVLQPDREQCKCDTFHQVKAWDEFRCNDCAGYEDENIIPLTPDNAFKWRDWAVEKFGVVVFRRNMEEVQYYSSKKSHAFSSWVSCYAKPSHYIKAACLCALEVK